MAPVPAEFHGRDRPANRADDAAGVDPGVRRVHQARRTSRRGGNRFDPRFSPLRLSGDGLLRTAGTVFQCPAANRRTWRRSPRISRTAFPSQEKILLGVQLYVLISRAGLPKENLISFYQFMTTLGVAGEAINIVYQLNTSELSQPNPFRKSKPRSRWRPSWWRAGSRPTFFWSPCPTIIPSSRSGFRISS